MAATPGLVTTVINNGANILNVFPAGTDQINNLGASQPFAVPPGGVAEFFTTASGAWHTVLSAAGGPQQAYNAVATAASFTFTGAQITGGSVEVTVDLTGAIGAGSNAQLPTVAQLVAAMTAAGINPQAGLTYELDIINRNGGANAWTITTNTGWTLTGTMTIASGNFRKFYVTLSSLTAAVLRSLGTIAIGVA
jgi:hypothetical protein